MQRQKVSGKFPTEKPPDPESKSPGAVAAHGAPEIDELGRHVASENILQQHFTQAPIRAALIGSNHCEAEGITAPRGSVPVLALCRALIEAGHDPNRPLHAYRGDVLALSVRSIGQGARLRVASHGVGFERLPECTEGSPIRENGASHHPPLPTRTSSSGGVS